MTPLRIALAAILAAGMLIGGAAVAGAQTSWESFGSSWAHNRGSGEEGSPDISLSSVTKKNPETVRYTIKNHAATKRSVDVSWHLACWNNNSNNSASITKSGSYPATIEPKATLIGIPGFDPIYKWCELDVNVTFRFPNVGDNGKLTLKLQAQY